MTAFVDRRTGLDVIDRQECVALLARTTVGRLALWTGSTTEVFPVNYAVDGEDIVFRSADGTKVRLAQRADVAFEIDELDPATRSGWSVVVHGRVEEVAPHVAATYAERLGVDPWSPSEKPHVLRIRATSVTGRRISTGS